MKDITVTHCQRWNTGPAHIVHLAVSMMMSPPESHQVALSHEHTAWPGCKRARHQDDRLTLIHQPSQFLMGCLSTKEIRGVQGSIHDKERLAARVRALRQPPRLRDDYPLISLLPLHSLFTHTDSNKGNVLSRNNGPSSYSGTRCAYCHLHITCYPIFWSFIPTPVPGLNLFTDPPASGSPGQSSH